jgi:DNA-binding Lrp family transcriptional regulator
LFNVQSGSENKVLNTVKKVEGVEEAYISFGVYDIAAKLRTDYIDDLKDIIQNKLRQITGVRSTSSLVLVEK